MLTFTLTKKYGKLTLGETVDLLEAGEKAIKDLERIKGCFDELEYHRFGMGCGLEDRDIIDRYEAMEYGWERAIEQVAEIITPR